MFNWNRARFRKFVLCLLVFVFFLNLGAQQFFVVTRPEYPRPEAGRIYALNEHGTIVYLTFLEHLIVGPFSFVVVFILMLVWVFLHRGRDGTWDRAGDER
jgi:hypothetical protein